MSIRDRLDLWLHPKRWLDDLQWVLKTPFWSFVGFTGLQLGLMALGLFLFFEAFFSNRSAIPTRNLRLAMYIYLPGAVIGAAIIWLTAYWHFKVRRDRHSV